MGECRSASGCPNVVALQLAFSKETLDAILRQWGTDGVRYYQLSTLAIDYVFPVAYSVQFSRLFAVLGTRPGREPGTVDLACFAVPLAAGLLDCPQRVTEPAPGLCPDTDPQFSETVLASALESEKERLVLDQLQRVMWAFGWNLGRDRLAEYCNKWKEWRGKQGK